MKLFSLSQFYAPKSDCYEEILELLKSAGNKQINIFKCGNESEEVTTTSYKDSHLLL